MGVSTKAAINRHESEAHEPTNQTERQSPRRLEGQATTEDLHFPFWPHKYRESYPNHPILTIKTPYSAMAEDFLKP